MAWLVARWAVGGVLDYHHYTAHEFSSRPMEGVLIEVPQRYSYDCLDACLASIFECPYEEVPHTWDVEKSAPMPGWMRTIWQWVGERGYLEWHFGLWGEEKPYLMFGSEQIKYSFCPPGFWMAAVQSPRIDGLHAIVMQGSKIAWDPNPQREMGHLGFREGTVFVKR